MLVCLVRSDRPWWRFSEFDATLGITPTTLSTRRLASRRPPSRSISTIPRWLGCLNAQRATLSVRVEDETTRTAQELDPMLKELRARVDEHGLETGLETAAE